MIASVNNVSCIYTYWQGMLIASSPLRYYPTCSYHSGTHESGPYVLNAHVCISEKKSNILLNHAPKFIRLMGKMDLGFLITQSLYNQIRKKNNTVLIEISALLKRNVIPSKWSNRTDVKINLKIDEGGKWEEAGIGRDRAAKLWRWIKSTKVRKKHAVSTFKPECLSQELPWWLSG